MSDRVIGIELYGATAITTDQAGSLVDITFHIMANTPTNAIPLAPLVQFDDVATPDEQQFVTTLADAQGALIISRGTDQVFIDSERLLQARRSTSRR